MGVGRVWYQTISGPQGDPFRYLSISVPHEMRCRVRDHHQYRFGTTSSVTYSNWAVLTKFATETVLVPNWISPGTEIDRYRSSHVVPNTSFLVPKWFGTERVWYRAWPNPSRSARIGRAHYTAHRWFSSKWSFFLSNRCHHNEHASAASLLVIVSVQQS